MSIEEGQGSSQLGLLQCKQCLERFGTAGQLFRHVESITIGKPSSCLEGMGMQMEEFRAEYTSRRRKVARKKVALKVGGTVLI